MGEEYLKRRIQCYLTGRMPKNEAIMDEIFAFDVYKLEGTSSVKLSQFIIGLSQFLIYVSSQINNTKIAIMQKKRIIDEAVVKSDLKSKTQVEKRLKIIENDPNLKALAEQIAVEEQELVLTDNYEKYLLELASSFKRELTRRDAEYRLSRV
jgi:hypothetical protein